MAPGIGPTVLRVDVVLCPGGSEDPDRERSLETLYIWNISDLADTSDYDVLRVTANHANGNGRVVGHERGDGCLVLVEKALAALRERLISTVQEETPGVASTED